MKEKLMKLSALGLVVFSWVFSTKTLKKAISLYRRAK